MFGDDDALRESQGKTGFAVAQKTDCPHLDKHINGKSIDYDTVFVSHCNDCGHQDENWVCCECGKVFCSRYVNGDMAKHAKESGHGIASSMSDLSFWCYLCEDYIDNPDAKLQLVRKKLEHTKFPPNDPNTEEKINQAIDKIVNKFYK